MPAAADHQHSQDLVLQLLGVDAAVVVGDRRSEDLLDGVPLEWACSLGCPVFPVVLASQPSEQIQDACVVRPIVLVDGWLAVAGEDVVQVSGQTFEP